MGPMERATEAYLEQSTWLDHRHEPMVQGLRTMAFELDRRFSAATFQQYGLAFRWLAKQAPDGDGEDKDPLEALLDGE